MRPFVLLAAIVILCLGEMAGVVLLSYFGRHEEVALLLGLISPVLVCMGTLLTYMVRREMDERFRRIDRARNGERSPDGPDNHVEDWGNGTR